MSTRPAVVFLDAGGTLLRPARPVGQIYADLAAHYGLQADAAALHQGFLKAWATLKPRDPVQDARVLDDRLWWKQVVRLSWNDCPLPDAFPFDDYFDEVYAAFARPELWRVFPEVPQVLETLHQHGFRCAVLSNWDRRLPALLDALELTPRFERILISSEIGAEKPHPAIFRAAESLMGITGHQAILWGDEEEADLIGARAAGWQAALVQRPQRDLTDLLDELLRSNPI